MNWKFWKTSYYGTSAESSTLANIVRILFGLIALYLIAALAAGCLVVAQARSVRRRGQRRVYASDDGIDTIVTGYTIATTFHRITETLLHKRGGYLSNDRFPPGVWLDNMPNWEFGALTQVRDMSRSMRIDFARSQSQSAEDQRSAERRRPLFLRQFQLDVSANRIGYTEGNKLVRSYAKRLASKADSDGQFYARADNLQSWLEGVESRLGNLSQQLSASVGKRQLDLALAGDANATQSTATASEGDVKTPGPSWTIFSSRPAATPGHSFTFSVRLKLILPTCWKTKTRPSVFGRLSGNWKAPRNLC